MKKSPKPPGPAIHCTFTEMVPVEKLQPNERNPNRHSPAQLALYWKIISHQGIRRAIVVSNQSGKIVTGPLWEKVWGVWPWIAKPPAPVYLNA